MRSVFSKENLFLLGFCLIVFSSHLWRGLYADEVITWNNTQKPLDELVQGRLTAGHLPTWFILEWAWVKIVGDSEIGLRSLSLLFTIAGVFAVKALAWRLSHDRTLSMAAAYVFTIHQLTIWSAQTARPYAPLLLLAPLVVYTAIRWIETGRIRHLVSLSVTTLAGLSIQTTFWPFVLSVLTLLLISPRSYRKRSWIASAMIVLAGILVTPLLLSLGDSQQTMQTREWSFPLDKLRDGVSHVFFGDYTLLHDKDIWMYLLLGAMLVTIFGSVQYFRRMKPPASIHGGKLLILWALIPVAFLFVAQAAGNSILAHERYYVIILPAIAICTAAAMRHSGKWAYITFPAILAIISAAWIVKTGDGSKRFARAIGEPAAIAGKAGPLIYEYRHSQVDLRFARVLDKEQLIENVAQLATDYEEIWLVVFDNKESELDELLDSPPSPWIPERREKHGHMRGVLIRTTDD